MLYEAMSHHDMPLYDQVITVPDGTNYPTVPVTSTSNRRKQTAPKTMYMCILRLCHFL